MFSITVTIVIITSIISYLAFKKPQLQEDLLFFPAAIKQRNQYYRFFTHGFIHADLNHLLFNMISLYSFGEYVERYVYSYPILFGVYGRVFYLVLYLTAIIAAVIPDYFIHRNSPAYRSLGASGAVSAVIFSGILLRPLTPVQLFFIPIDIPGFIFGGVFLLLSVVLAKVGKGNIAHGAHFAGAVYGIIFTTVAGKIFADYNAVKTFIHILRFDWIL